jgi:hypothetical protein
MSASEFMKSQTLKAAAISFAAGIMQTLKAAAISFAAGIIASAIIMCPFDYYWLIYGYQFVYPGGSIGIRI